MLYDALLLYPFIITFTAHELFQFTHNHMNKTKSYKKNENKNKKK